MRWLIIKYFLVLATVAGILDLIVPLFIPTTNILVVALAPGSSIIFGFGLYLAVKKSEGELLPASLPQLLTIF